MRSTHRRPSRRRRRRVPARSRVTVRRAVAALRRSRQVLEGVEGELDGLLVALRKPEGDVDAATPDRLHAATAEVEDLLGQLADLRRLF